MNKCYSYFNLKNSTVIEAAGFA